MISPLWIILSTTRYESEASIPYLLLAGGSACIYRSILPLKEDESEVHRVVFSMAQKAIFSRLCCHRGPVRSREQYGLTPLVVLQECSKFSLDLSSAGWNKSSTGTSKPHSPEVFSCSVSAESALPPCKALLRHKRPGKALVTEEKCLVKSC
jgi:hypothetical protein